MVHLRIFDIKQGFTARDILEACTTQIEALVIALFEWKYIFHCDDQIGASLGEVALFSHLLYDIHALSAPCSRCSNGQLNEEDRRGFDNSFRIGLYRKR